MRLRQLEQLFHLTIRKIFSSDFLFLFSNDNNLKMMRKIKFIIIELISLFLKQFRIIPKSRKSSLGRFPRFHPLLLTINRDYFINNNIEYGYSYLTVYDYDTLKNNSYISEHRILGDSGATLLSSIARAGGYVINIDYNNYVKHGLKGSYGQATSIGTRWNWFSKKNLI